MRMKTRKNQNIESCLLFYFLIKIQLSCLAITKNILQKKKKDVTEKKEENWLSEAGFVTTKFE